MENKRFTLEEKIHIVREYMSNTLSAKEMAEKYGLANPDILKVWKFRYLKSEENLVKPKKKANFAAGIPDGPKQDAGTTMAKEDTQKPLEEQIKQLQRELAWEKLRNEALNTLIDIAESEGIKIRKKLWGQAVEKLSNAENSLSIQSACRLFGHCRQAWYQKKKDYEAKNLTDKAIVEAVKKIREIAPGIGCRKLWLMGQSVFGGLMIGRDAFYRLMARNGLKLKKPKARHTTNSNHRYHKYKNLVKGFVPMRPNQLWVSDITYIQLANGCCCYLHLVTDAYSHKIIGWYLSPTLEARYTLEALRQAISQAEDCDLTQLIHHSDRGVQYCCNMYVSELERYGIKISMTEDYKPTDNGIAERVNGIIKEEKLNREPLPEDIDKARKAISGFIEFYNTRRPHMSIGYKTPSEAHRQQGEQVKAWRSSQSSAGAIIGVR